MPNEYAHALANSLAKVNNEEDIDSLVTNLISALNKSGKMKALPAILKEFKRILIRKKAHQPTITIARNSERDYALRELKKHINIIPSETIINVDENIIGGWRYIYDDLLIDSSYKSALLKLYRKIIKI